MSNKPFDVSTHYQSGFFKHLDVPQETIDDINTSLAKVASAADEKLSKNDWLAGLFVVSVGLFIPVVAHTQVLVPYVAPVLAVMFLCAGVLTRGRR